MNQTKRIAACALLASTCGCAQYFVIAAEPRSGGQWHSKTQASIAGGTAASPPQVVGRACGPDEQLAMVRVTRNFGQGLLSFVTLGMYGPATVHYRCATAQQPEGGEIDTSGDA